MRNSKCEHINDTSGMKNIVASWLVIWTWITNCCKDDDQGTEPSQGFGWAPISLQLLEEDWKVPHFQMILVHITSSGFPKTVKVFLSSAFVPPDWVLSRRKRCSWDLRPPLESRRMTFRAISKAARTNCLECFELSYGYLRMLQNYVGE